MAHEHKSPGQIRIADKFRFMSSYLFPEFIILRVIGQFSSFQSEPRSIFIHPANICP